VRLLQAAVDHGINLFDTSDLYSQGQSEIVLGKAFKGRRSAVVVATKGGYLVSRQSRLASKAKPILRPVAQVLGLKRPTGRIGVSVELEQNFSPDHLSAAVDASLKRLQTDYIDIYQLHSPSRATVDAGEYVGALDAIRAQGKIRYFGVAVDDPADAANINRYPTVRSVQLPFSCIDQRASSEILPTATANGVGVISRSCFAAGLLVSSMSADELRDRTPDAEAIMVFRRVAATLGRSRQELALQFNLGVAGISVTIIGMRTEEHLRDVIRDATCPALTAEELRAVRALAGAGDGTQDQPGAALRDRAQGDGL
jgi:aryl-alcohol dehydrogenase-like predicted oxidoreductase